MKRILILCSLVATFSAAHAQTTDKSYARDVHVPRTRTHTQAAPLHDSRFEGTEMAHSEGNISFSNVPELAKQPWAVITDENGELMKQTRVINEENIDVHKLSRGMYFVSLVYKNKTEKAFVLEIE